MSADLDVSTDAYPLKFYGHVLLGRDPGLDPELTGMIILSGLGIPQEELESVAGERDVWVFLLGCCLCDPSQSMHLKYLKMHG